MIDRTWRRIHRRILDTEISVHEYAAGWRRHLLGTALHEDMPGHPERIADIDPEGQDEFDDIVMAALDRDLFYLIMRTGWGR
ncbi:hypothetical protein [Nocardiopsis sp. YSL2]|uniref:hypothetical protein n=1 Tax=Nocardiopsis sp. YSL2 TaxID=2939492 RepID=UPI0026F465BC|nr:hypothetical protein [Nocardiopsis sp. YSL2]